jgi:gamma-glutamylcyclotransferase (GGCT)/AIG2-like uncharacterized protein YtfP
MIATALCLFAYGTLQRGGRYHERFCRGVRLVESATVRGRVYVLPAGYPVLTVPAASILARGSADPLADVATQANAVAEELTAPSDERGDCDDIRGEILVFDDPEQRLPQIDALEGFRPSGASLYARVLLTVRCERDARLVPAWAYVEGELLRAASRPKPKRPRGTTPWIS